MSKSARIAIPGTENEPLWRRTGMTFYQIIESLTERAGGKPRGGRKKSRAGETLVRWFSYITALPHNYDHDKLLSECERLGLEVRDAVIIGPSPASPYQRREATVVFPKDLVTSVTKTTGMKEVEAFIESVLPKEQKFSKSHMKSKGYLLYKIRDLKPEHRHQVEHAILGVLLDRLDDWREQQRGLVSYEFKKIKDCGVRSYAEERGWEILDVANGMCHYWRYHLEIRVYQGVL